jgi:hypothetical protein
MSGRHGVLGALWRRAPAWRALFYLASLLSAIVLFLPSPTRRTHALWQETASFTPTPQSVRDSVSRVPGPQPDTMMAAGVGGAPSSTVPDVSAPPVGRPAVGAPPPAHSVDLGAPSSSLPTDPNAPPISTDVGKVYTGTYVVHGRGLPLLPGEWTVLAKMDTKRTDGDLDVVFLGQISGKRLNGAALLLDYANFRSGWSPHFSRCSDPSNLDSTVEEFDSRGRQACWMIHSIFSKAWSQWRDRNTKLDPIIRAAAGQLDVKGIDYPQSLLQVFFHLADGSGAMDVAYFFNPDTAGLSSGTAVDWQSSDWAARNIGKFPDKVAYEKGKETWVRGWWPKIKKVFALPRG